MSLSFPVSPSVGQLYKLGNKTWKWNGAAWLLETLITNPGALYVTTDKFTGDGTTTIYNLSVTPDSNNQVQINMGGIIQLKSAFTLENNVLTFTGAPADGVDFEVTTFAAGSADALTAANNALSTANSALAIANTTTSTGKAIAMAMVFGF